MSHTIRSTGPEVPGTGPPVDVARVRREVGEVGLDDLADELVQTLVDEAPVLMEALEAANDDRDPEPIQRAAHPFNIDVLGRSGLTESARLLKLAEIVRSDLHGAGS